MSTARPKPGALLARLSDIPDPGAITREFSADAQHFGVLIARRGDAVFAYENRCPHAGYPLQRADGRVVVQEGRYLVCAGHGASFALDTGACAGGPCIGSDRLTPIAIDVIGDEILIRQA